MTSEDIKHQLINRMSSGEEENQKSKGSCCYGLKQNELGWVGWKLFLLLQSETESARGGVEVVLAVMI